MLAVEVVDCNFKSVIQIAVKATIKDVIEYLNARKGMTLKFHEVVVEA